MRLLFLLPALFVLGFCVLVFGSFWVSLGWLLFFSFNASMMWVIDMGASAGDSSRVVLPISGGEFQGPKMEGTPAYACSATTQLGNLDNRHSVKEKYWQSA